MSTKPTYNSPSKLLIVDDLAENLQALSAIIRGDNRVVYQASSGEEALALMLDHEFALAILDVQMPGMDGFELAKLMRSTVRTRHIPIVFVTAAASEQRFDFRGYESGAVDFLYKPLDVDAVKSKVNVFVALHQQRLETQRQVLALEQSRKEQETLLHQLQQTQEQLEQSILMRDNFMSMVAHELRTPLNTLFLDVQVRTLQLERDNLAAFSKPELLKMTERDRRQIKNMIRLIDDMLDLSRISSDKLSIRPVETDLSELLERLVHDFTPQAQSAGYQLRLDILDRVEGKWDAFRLEQIIVNLLTNAMRYGNGNPITLTLHQQGNTAVVAVRDQGHGISPEDQERIFQAFERGQGNQVKSGLGLGLYIAQQLAEAHAGSIAVQSTLNAGSTFTLSLPLVSQQVEHGADA
ncbi:hybrid sensor histidine kinase/response regulator [Methylobacillus glycogenes]|uniref:hybrid sensor histidine kinase/response regulator n=1 Tax=Methylobacillus glycogenes TaxID=406 RepID=UPI000471C9B6|nr:hybrid sensor histidine kinase/response regulator [Methylobacillus glycogenes]MBL8505448.1 hybrid sensor histidine kinase/response regulator [Methylobacillus glycogenes]